MAADACNACKRLVFLTVNKSVDVSVFGIGGSMQTTRRIAGLTVLAVCVAAGAISASDRTAVYARIDRVVLEPTAESPQRAQVWGVFAMAKPNDMNDYLPPARGYLYFALATNPQAAQKEWADLQSVAGTNQVVGFGSRWELKARVRNADEKPEKADAYAMGIGVTKIRRTDYAPVRALLDARP
jgi:hypothetical protein